MDAVDCLIPAAGRSSRMGTWKLMLPFGGKSVIETVVSTALNVCARVVLVTGYRSDDLTSFFDGSDCVTTIENTDWRNGMFSTVRAGIEAVKTRRFFITLADMPLVDSDVYRVILRASKIAPENQSDDVFLPIFNGRRGHPVLLPNGIIPKIRNAGPEITTMKQIIRRERIREVAWKNDTIHRDLDTLAEYKSALHRPE